MAIRAICQPGMPPEVWITWTVVAGTAATARSRFR